MAFEEDLQGYVNDFGVPCVFGAFSFLGIFDQADIVQDLQPLHVQTREYELRYITSQATLTRGQAGTVEGVAYKVREAPLSLADGAFSSVRISKV